MTIKQTLLSVGVVLTGLTATAQEAAEEFEYVFNPYWYGQLQFGAQETLGETKFGDLLAPNAQVALRCPSVGQQLAEQGFNQL